jgi:DNA-binding transcriptional MerR regulator
VAILKKGKHLLGSGKELDIADKELDDIVSSYDPKVHEAPVTKGHFDNEDAKAWIAQLKRVGQYVIAKLSQIKEDFEKEVKEGRWKKRSVGLKWNEVKKRYELHHVAFLGAETPAVKGMPDPAFSAAFTEGIDGEEFTWFQYDVTETNDITPFTSTAKITTDKSGDTDMTEQDVKKLIEDERKKFEAEFSEKLQTAEKQAAELKSQLDKKDAELKKKDVELAEHAQAQRRTEFASFFEERVKEGRAIPVWKDSGIIAFMESLASEADTVNLSEGKTETRLEWFKKFLTGLPTKMVQLGEMMKREETIPPDDKTKRIQAAAGDTPIIGLEDVAKINALAAQLRKDDKSLSGHEAFAKAHKMVEGQKEQ